MAKFINEHPSIFEQLGRYFKRKGKKKAESSKPRPDSPPVSVERPYSKHLRRVSLKQEEKQSSKVGGMLRAWTDSMCRKTNAYPPQRKAQAPVDSYRPSLFIPEISEDPLPLTSKLLNIRYYNGEGDPKDHVHTFAYVFQLYPL